MKKILIISVLCNIAFSSFILCMQQPEATGAELELFEAIDKGDATRVQQLINEGAEFRATRMYKGSGINPINPLDFAKNKGKLDIIDAINQAYKLTSHQRFFAAIEEGDISKIEKIIINGRFTNVDMPRDKERNTALILAVQKEDVPLVRQLLLWKADINIQNTKGESAFTLALKSKNKNLITVLLETAYNIEIDQPDSDGNTPLMLAIQNGDLEIIEKIVAEVPDTTKKNLQGKDAYDLVGLVKDTENKSKIAELLINAEKQYELYDAILKGDFTVLKSSDAPLNITSAERNPLVVAISQRNKKLVEEIINKGADVNQFLRGNKTPLWSAVLSANIDIFRFLLEKGAKPDVPDIYDRYTPIFRALRYNKYELITDFIKYKANVNYQSSSYFPGKPRNVTPLMLAVEVGEPDFVKKLLDADADPLLKNSEGKTALDMAQEREKTATDKEAYQKIITFLENKIKTIAPSKPSTPIKPSIPTITPTTSAQLMSLLQNFTEQLRILERRLAV